MFFKEILSVLAGVCIGSHAMAIKESSFNKWVDKYPSSEFFKDIENEHLKFLPEFVKNQAIQELTVIVPIQKVGDFLLIQGCRPHKCPFENYALFVSLSSPLETYMCMWKRDFQESESGTMTWYGTKFKTPLSFTKIKAPLGCSFEHEKLELFVERMSPEIPPILQEKAISSLVEEELKEYSE